ncbi:RrF2 family transcriptional regulator [Acidithiobacillus ferrianus]|uniref:RrF2 family transcriptional regulator n=1 Tax=Acidithiobacillus ferrianus TaxID=2678518 RepID=UPI00230B8348|nr:Rrf2 family transcriptional regulator [Acidithiobacillus sp.]
MILSKASEYALRILVYLAAQPSGEPVLSRVISDCIGGGSVPCVNKVLRWLAKRGVLDSVKGKGGGFVLRPGAESLSIVDVIEIVEGRPVELRCVLGFNICAKETVCPVHSQWETIHNNEIGFLRGQTIGTMSNAIFWHGRTMTPVQC